MKLAMSLILAVTALAADASTGVFWTRSNNSIWESDAGGGNVQTVVSGATNLMDIAFDTVNNKLYWTNRSWGIYRANVDGNWRRIDCSH